MNKIKKTIMTPLSDGMVRQCLGLLTPIVKYSELKQYNHIYDLLPTINSFAVILLEDDINSGHWCAVMRLPAGLYYFNSYGSRYDTDLSVIPMCIRRILGQDQREFKRLLGGDLDMDYNKVKYQNNKSMVCGRYVCVVITYCCMMGFSPTDFNKFLVDKKKELKMKTYDDLIARLCPI
jgi:hypothetical protein